MVQGFDRREVVQDPNARGSIDQGSVPLNPVMSPRPSSMSRIGENERKLADVLGKASLGFKQYFDKKTDEWALEGQMAYMEGKTEEEIVAKGNRYTTAGFMTMKARTSANEWFQQALDEIESGDKQLSSQEYQAKLKDQYRVMVDEVAGKDEFTRNLMTTIAANTFPQLVEQQIKSNNSWREQETYNSYTTMLLSEANHFDPTNPDSSKNLSELLDPEVSGLPPELHRKAITEAVTTGLELDNDQLFNVLGLNQRDKIKALENGVLPRGLLSAVMLTESNGRDFDKNGNVLTSSKGAKGRMQVLDGTNIDPGFGVTPAQDDSLEERARVGRDYLAAMLEKYDQDPVLAVMAYNWGPGALDAHIQKVGNPMKGEVSYEAFLQGAPKETQNYVKRVDGYLKQDAELVSTQGGAAAQLIQAGFTPAQIKSVMSSYDSYATRKGNEFNKERVLLEQAILKDAGEQGNLEQSLDEIEKYKDVYGDSWANSMSGKAVTAITKYEDERRERIELERANANGTVNLLGSNAKIQKAIELKKAEIAQIVHSQESMTDEAKGEIIRQETAKYLVDNKVIDDKWADAMQGALSGEIVGKDGVVKEDAIRAYDDYLLLSKLANPGYAAQYLGDAEDLIVTAEAYDGGGGMTTEQALGVASTILTRKRTDANFTPPVPKAELIDKEVDKLIDNYDSWWHFGTKDYKTRNWEVTDYEIEQAKSDPRLRTLLKDYATRFKLLNPNIPDKAAVLKARNEVSRRVDFIMGNVLISGRQSTIREDMGLNTAEPTTLNKVGLEYLRQNGKKMWGDAFSNKWMGVGFEAPDFQILGDEGNRIKGIPAALGASMQDVIRGTPAALWEYDPDLQVFRVDLYENKERTKLLNKPYVIPAKVLGQFANELFAPTN